jgi:hypothetical protein
MMRFIQPRSANGSRSATGYDELEIKLRNKI